MAEREPHILISNDDGIHSLGLAALAAAMADIGRVTIVAPERERSAVGRGITLHKPLRAEPVEMELSSDSVRAYVSNGTPSDCVVLGCLDLIGRAPDLVVGGINRGGNFGEDVLYSGTVSVAMEGAIMGLPAFAISVAPVHLGEALPGELDYAVAARFAGALAERILAHALPPDSFLNVNVPALPPDRIAGVAVTRFGRMRYRERLDKRHDPRGTVYYWLAGEPQLDGAPEGTDIRAVVDGKISVTHADMNLTSPVSAAHLAAVVPDESAYRASAD
ncbi:MAG: 5'/3'-nucleotidase SurE [Armatimonadota bacterium]|jgi:5'-nucleotidase